MPRRNRRFIPPPPPINTFIVCALADETHVLVHYRKQTNEDVLPSERCPEQHAIRLPNRLKLLARSGAWFDTSLDAGWVAHAILYQNQREALTASGKPRCQAWQVDGVTQCRHSAVEPTYTDVPRFCKSHYTKRDFRIHEPGAGLDEQNANPLDESALSEISSVGAGIGSVLYDLSRLQSSAHLADEDAARVGTIYADLHDLRARLEYVVSGDRERDAKQRRELTNRLQRMVDRIVIARKIEGVDVHMAFIRSGGKKQSEMTIEELKGKVDWMFRNYEDVFPADVREWQPPDVQVSGMEPGGIRRKTSDDLDVVPDEDD